MKDNNKASKPLETYKRHLAIGMTRSADLTPMPSLATRSRKKSPISKPKK